METIFQDTIREMTDHGLTVLLSSHILAQVEALCDGVTIIRAGHTVERGTLAELRHLTRTAVSVETERPVTGLDLPGVHNLVVDGNRAKFDVDTAQLDGAIKHLTGLGIRTLTSQPPTLEELFLRHYGDEIALLERTDLEGSTAR
jgi:ABC-2 type transport system ATP-binding protein